MAKPARVMPVYYPSLGAYLLAQREERKWSVARLIAHAKRAGHPLTPQQVRGVEMGTTRFIDPDIFRALGAAYRIPYAALVARLILEAYGPEADLIGHTAVGQQVGGLSHVVALEARLQQLETENTALRDAIDAIKGATASLSELTPHRGQDTQAGGHPAKSGRHRGAYSR